VGISKVSELSELDRAIETASLHDTRIIVEQGLISPKEIEVAVL